MFFKSLHKPTCCNKSRLKKQLKVIFLTLPKYPTDVWWRYFTTLHQIGTAMRLTRDEHILHLDRIESRRYYSKASVNAMEERYLALIAELRKA
jgi:hypothetical protein